MPRIIIPTPIQEERPLHKRISWWFENTIIRSLKGFLNDARETLRDILIGSFNDFTEEFEHNLIDLVRPFASQILATPGLPAYIRAPIEEAMTGRQQAGIAILLALGGGLIGGAVGGFTGPIGRVVQQQVERIFESYLLDPATLTVLKTRGIIGDARFRVLMHYNGLSVEDITFMENLAIPLFDDASLTQMMYRGINSDTETNQALVAKGYRANQIAKWKAVREVIPSPSDLVSMAVREAFNDETARTFGYDEDYPAEAAQWSEKQGMSEVWFRRFWRAHWNLPGLVQVREMYNRGIITDGQLNIYLRAADIPRFWREAITKWFKAEVTRVDVRRIFSLGLLSTEEVFERYLRLGYNAEDSGLMTQWTVAQYLEADRELTKTDILSMYEEGILNENEAETYLTALDYRPEAIYLLLAQRDLKRQAKYEKQIIENVRKLYVNGVYNRTDVYDQLGKLDTPATFIEQSLAVWDLEIKNKVLIPTTAQLRDMAQEDIISIARFREELGKRGYANEYIGWYEQLWLKD